MSKTSETSGRGTGANETTPRSTRSTPAKKECTDLPKIVFEKNEKSSIAMNLSENIWQLTNKRQRLQFRYKVLQCLDEIIEEAPKSNESSRCGTTSQDAAQLSANQSSSSLDTSSSQNDCHTLEIDSNEATRLAELIYVALKPLNQEQFEYVSRKFSEQVFATVLSEKDETTSRSNSMSKSSCHASRYATALPRNYSPKKSLLEKFITQTSD